MTSQQVSDKHTIFSLSSGKPPAGIAVLRVSGSEAGVAVRALAGMLPAARRATLCRLHGADGAVLDDAVVLWFPGPASFTGEDVAELHVTGGPAVVGAVLSALSAVPGLRPARAGEFTRRAFDNGKLDLTQAEGLADLIDADTEAQRRQALRQAAGGLKALAEDWHGRLLGLLAETEASLDFGEDEEDVSTRLVADQSPEMTAIHREISGHLARYRFGERLRRGLTFVIVGRPNAGKSTLINALARRDVAIVSPEPGTTRDAIEVQLQLDDIPVTLVDTAGLRDTTEAVESEGVKRARLRAQDADLVVHLIAADSTDTPFPDALIVSSKADLAASPHSYLRVSATTGQGLDALEAQLATRARDLIGGSEEVLVTRERQRAALADCAVELKEALGERDVVLRAESVRRAMRALGQLTGQTSVDDILDVVFGRFCIGK